MSLTLKDLRAVYVCDGCEGEDALHYRSVSASELKQLAVEVLKQETPFPELFYCATHGSAHLGDCGYKVVKVLVLPLGDTP